MIVERTQNYMPVDVWYEELPAARRSALTNRTLIGFTYHPRLENGEGGDKKAINFRGGECHYFRVLSQRSLIASYS